MSQNQQQSLATNQLEALDTLKFLQKMQRALQLTQLAYKRSKTKSFPPIPMPVKDCIPTMASAEQTYLYEAQFAGMPWEHLDNQTISDFLKIYSSPDTQIPSGKISFLHGFFQKITAKNMNLDVVVLCKDLETQRFLFSALETISLNCDHVGSYIDRQDTFGVIVKMRKAGKPVTPIKQATQVDLVLAYDSAIAVPRRVLSQFKGVGHYRPLIAHISTMDSADIRCYQYSAERNQYSWYTQYKTIQDAQAIFHQPNRRATLQDFVAWNDYIATEVAEWVALKQNIPYQFFRPHKGHAATKAYGSWGGGPSLNDFRINPIALLAPFRQSHVAVLPPVATTNTAHPSPSPPSQPFYLPSSSSTLMQIDPTPSTASATAGSSMQAFDFKSILDRAMKEFEEDANKFFNKI